MRSRDASTRRTGAVAPVGIGQSQPRPATPPTATTIAANVKDAILALPPACAITPPGPGPDPGPGSGRPTFQPLRASFTRRAWQSVAPYWPLLVRHPEWDGHRRIGRPAYRSPCGPSSCAGAALPNWQGSFDRRPRALDHLQLVRARTVKGTRGRRPPMRDRSGLS